MKLAMHSVENCINMVRVKGLEPPRLAAPEPKSGASTNSATPARRRRACQRSRLTSKALTLWREAFSPCRAGKVRFFLGLSPNVALR